MKETQSVFFTGYVTISVKGHHPELFFDLCAREGVTVWNVRKLSEVECQGSVRLGDISRIKTIRRRTIYKVSFIRRHGIPFLTKRFFLRKPLWIALLASVLFVFFLSNIVWEVKVKGVPAEIEKQIVDHLEEYGIHRGAIKLSIAPPAKIQQKLLDDVPELLWIGVTERGTTYHLEGVEKTVVDEKEQLPPRNLVASKEGVIVDMYVSKGQPMVEVNDFVKKGDLLVSGELGKQESETEEDDDEKEESNHSTQLVAAEGEVIAKTWYESDITVPFDVSYEVLTGESKHRYFIKFGNFSIPIWGFTKPDYDQVQIETNEKSFQFLKWNLPIYFVDQNIQEKENVRKKRTKEQAIEDAIIQAQTSLQEQLGKKAEITFEKVLHESIDNGKVKLKIYFSVLENIATNQPISQGD